MTILNLRIWEHLLSLESHCKEHCILCECVCDSTPGLIRMEVPTDWCPFYFIDLYNELDT